MFSNQNRIQKIKNFDNDKNLINFTHSKKLFYSNIIYYALFENIPKLHCTR